MIENKKDYTIFAKVGNFLKQQKGNISALAIPLLWAGCLVTAEDIHTVVPEEGQKDFICKEDPLLREVYRLVDDEAPLRLSEFNVRAQGEIVIMPGPLSKIRADDYSKGYLFKDQSGMATDMVFGTCKLVKH